VNLNELLSELRNNILYDRHESDDDDDRLWSDATLVRYINEAQRKFAIKGLVIRDSTTPEVVNVTLEEGTTEYTLHPSILAVLSAKIDGYQSDLVRVGHSALAAYTSPNSVLWDPNMEFMAPGSPLAFTTDEQVVEDDDSTVSAVSMRIFPEPDADADGTVIKLRVVRKPLDELTVNNLSAVPEIPIDYHRDMLDYAASLALRIVDTDAGNEARADKFLQRFEGNVAEARKMVMRKLFTPQGWGFGKAGFSWCS
jgi:hypothetical protein